MATKAHSVLLPVILLTRASLSGVEPDCGLLLQVARHALQRVCFFCFFCFLCFFVFFVFCVFFVFFLFFRLLKFIMYKAEPSFLFSFTIIMFLTLRGRGTAAFS